MEQHRKTLLMGLPFVVISLVIIWAGVGQCSTVYVDESGAPLALGPSVYSSTLVIWWGDVKSNPEKDCAIWDSSFRCELRRGGSADIVISQILTSTCESEVEVPDIGPCGNEVEVAWDISDLDIGDYEIYCRLEQTNGVEMWYGALKDAEGHDGEMFYLIDKITVGQICNIPTQFVIVR